LTFKIYLSEALDTESEYSGSEGPIGFTIVGLEVKFTIHLVESGILTLYVKGIAGGE
jgi:hypothetical protein